MADWESEWLASAQLAMASASPDPEEPNFVDLAEAEATAAEQPADLELEWAASSRAMAAASEGQQHHQAMDEEPPGYESLADFAPPAVRRGRPKLWLRSQRATAPSHTPSQSSRPSDTAAVPGFFGQALPQPAVQQELPPPPPSGLATLKVPELQSYEPKIVNGFPVAPVSGQALVGCRQQALNATDDAMDADYLKLAELHLTVGVNYHLASTIVQGSAAGIDRALLSPKLCRLAAAHWTMNRLARHLLETNITIPLPTMSLVSYCDFFSWDETPLRVSMRGGGGASAVSADFAEIQVDDDAAVKAIHRWTSSLRPDSVVCKVLQTQQWCGIVVQVEGHYLKILFEQVCPLQVLQKNSAQVLTTALRQQAGSSTHSQGFRFHGKMASFDKAPSNSKAFLTFCAEREQSNTLQLHCEVHAVSRAFASSFDGLVASHVTGLISCASSLRLSGMLVLFRQSLQEEVSERLAILRGHPSAEAVAHKQRVMATMPSGGSKNMPQMMVLALLPNGDWRSPQVQHFIPASDPVPNKALVTAKLVSGLCYALVGKKPALWARHRWTGCELAVEELGVMESIHQLLSTSYMRFLQKIEKPRPALPGADAAQQAAAPLEAALDRAGDQPQALATAGDDAAAAASARPEVGDPLLPADASNDPEQGAGSFAVVNAVNRSKAQSWLRGRPLDHLYTMRLTMEPLKVLLQKQFQVCSEAWELSQRAHVARSLRSAAVGGGCKRQYMLTIAAAGTHERAYFDDVRLLLQNYDAWELVGDQNRTIEFNHLAFRLLSRGGSLIEANLAHPHRQMPIKLFDILNNPDQALVLSQTPPCCLDPFSLALMESFPGLTGEQCKQTLELHALLGSTNIAQIESKHSSIRRHAVLKSTHTWTQQLRDLSAAWTLQQLRRAGVATCKCKPGGTSVVAKKSQQVLKVGAGTLG